MIARDYNKRIDINLYGDIPDGFGGNIAGIESTTTHWAKLINQVRVLDQRITTLGITDLYEPLIFKIRKSASPFINGRSYSLMYQGETYIIKSIIDIDEFHRELEILCTKKNDVNLPD